jgi:hypothetical protein
LAYTLKEDDDDDDDDGDISLYSVITATYFDVPLLLSYVKRRDTKWLISESCVINIEFSNSVICG